MAPEQIIEAIRNLPDKELERFTELYHEQFCYACGYEQPTSGQRCQCWNDE